MYVHVKPNIKQRVLSFFMAFAIIFVSLPYVGFEASAADGDSAVVTSSKSASVSGSYAITGGTANYTGKILDYADSSVDLFDYKSDQELDSANGSTITSSHASNYTDQHTYLNTAISEGNNYLVSQATNNITIAFSDSTVQSTDTVYVHLWDSVNNTSNNCETKWPGRKMTYDNDLGKFVYTFCPSVLGFTPDSLIFNGGNNTWQTGTIKLYETLEVGNTYSFTKESHGDVKIVLNVTGGASGSSMKIYLWNDSGNTGWVGDDPTESMVCVSGTQFSYNTGNKTWKNIIFYRKTGSGTRWQTKNVTNQTFNYGYTYTYSVNVTNTDWSGSSPDTPSVTATSSGSVKSYTKTSGSRDIYSQYKIPLYFGCFYNPNWTKGYKAAYNNFFWQPNMSLRTDSSASVQQLVDTTLGTSGELKCDGKELPYFSRTLADSDKYKYDFNDTQRNMIECYDDLDFKFYQIQTNASNVRGHDVNDTGKANFYQFNSQETYLYFNGTDFTETEIPIRSQGTQSDSNGTIGFYPFNNTNNSQLNNLAFGAKFTIKFKLSEDGKVETINPATGNGTGYKVNEVFEFRGDDDVWVFIDGKLVLDLGGVHKDTSGYIDFAEKKAVATSAVGYTTANRDNLDVSVSSIPKENTNVGTGSETFAFTDLLKDRTYYREHQQYNPETEHVMTLFYMERGMYESDLLVRFNFETVSNKNTLKVSEVTDFTDVNEGLREITQKAADNDVFQYTVYNKGTVNDDTRNSEILTPTFDAYTRNNAGYSTKLSGLETITYSDPESIFLNVEKWEDGGNYKYAVWYRQGKSRFLRIGEKVEIGETTNIYKFSVPDGTFSSTDDYFRFLRLSSDDTSVEGSSYPSPDPSYTAQRSGGPTKGALYRIKTNKTTADWVENSYTISYVPNVTRTTHNYTPGSTLPNPLEYVAVTNTNYLWTDGFSTKTGTDGKPLAGTTDETTGIFPLMYGTNGTGGTTQKESSALFKYQFKTDSDMKVVQSNTLAKPADREHAPFTTSTSARNVSSYYKTSVTIKDKYGQVVTDAYDDRDFSSGNAETTFDYVNSQTTQKNYPKDPVEITEEFTNRVLVGAISVKKELVHNTEPGDTFNFTLELTDVLGQDGVDVTDYDTIKVSVDGAAPVAGKITTSGGKGSFTLTKGQTLTIYGIPVGTEYTITETTPTTNYQKKEDNGKMSGTVKKGDLKEGKSDYSSYENYDPDNDNKAVVTNKRRTGSLKISKSIFGGNNAKTNDITNTKDFTFSIKLTEPTGVSFSNYIASEISGLTPQVVDGKNVYTLTKTVKQSEGEKVVISNIPYGTLYEVEETADENNQTIDYTYSPYEGEIKADNTVVNVTNVYRKVTMTKKDNKDTSKTLSGAEYILVRLKDAAYETASGHTVLTSGAIGAFNDASSSDFSGTLTAPLSTYVDGYSSILTTGTYGGTEHNDGKVVVNDSMITDGLKPGYYFFVELSPPSAYYDKNNDSAINYNDNGTTATQYKVFQIENTLPSTDDETQTDINYYDERKVGALIVQEDVLSSTVNAYADSVNQDFDVLVTLDGTVSGIDIDPRAFLTNDYLTNTIGATSINRDDNKKLSFTVPVSKSGGQKNILGLPLGVKYTVSQALPDISATLPDSRWINVGDNNNLNSSITSGSENKTFVHPLTSESVTYPTETAYIKNAMVGSLVLSKALAYGTTNTENKKFDFNVNMTIPDDVTIYTLQRTVGTGSASNITGLSGHDITISQTMSVGTDVTISNVPYGTTYSVEETEPGGDWGIINQVNTTNNTINNTTKTTTITNGKVGKLNLNKIIAGEYKKNGVKVGDDFEFTVTLTNNNNSLSNIKVDGVTPTISDQYNVTLTVSVPAAVSAASATPVVISNIPYGTTYSVSETQPENCTTTGGVTDQTIGNSNSVTITNTYTAPPPMSVTINMTKTDAETGTAITNSDETKRAKYRLLKLTETFETAYENNPTSVSNTFKNSTAYNDSTLESYKLSDSAETTVNEDGTISFSGTDVPGGDVYPGDIFFFYEVQAPDGYKKDNSVTDGKLITIVKGTNTYSVRYTDEPESMDVNLLKTDDSNNPLEGAQFDLYFKESYNPPTNSINESEISPKLLPSKSIDSANTEPTHPAVSNSETISSTRYSYTAAEAPDASESTWILPRTDNDYIYFRDYNISSSQYSGDNNGRWINTWFDTNEFGQSKEIFYDHRYWLKAVFTASGKETREYSVWERFVDHYDGKETVVWKIQPPDGYEYVEFILCDGANNNNHVRNTEKFKYVLGNIYTKTNKGKYDNGQYGYPVKGEHWSTYWDSTKHNGDPSDHRITYSTSTPNAKQYVFGESSKTGGTESTLDSMAQADRYIATPQKLVFHCNSKVVWHNIHIEFFDKNQQPIGQEFPGYMMEPYAYAGNDYRINGYLTYELTIPKDAKYFRVNDGITMDTTYGYYSRITEIYSGDTNKYYKIDGSYTNSNQKNIKLVQSTSFATNSGKKYTNQNEIESDYDYIYFATPKTGGWGKVYAHFYGGGDLQADNWQRACYSIWPGLAPVGTEYQADENGTKNVEHHSDIYNYTTNPDSTFEWKDGSTTYTVYKFRIPLGDRTNYKKVIFNNGLSKSSGGKLTSPIEYSAGYIYKKSGSPTKHYEEKNTYTYTGRGDELYVKMNSSTLAKWDDLHITFYDSGKNQILQGKDGYVMKYSGTDTSSNTYFSMPIPSNAAYFSLNNGIGKSDPHNLSLSGKYEILPLNASGDENTSQNFTKGNIVYTLNDSTLSKTLPEFTEDTSSSEVTLDAYPSPRGDYIYIKDVGGNTLTSPPPTFTFYNSSGSELTSPGVNTHAADGSDKWYSVGIPTDATEFTMNGGSTKYPIYQKTTETTTSDKSLNFTPGNMYYSATGNQILSLIWPTFSNTSEATNYNDDNWSNTKRSDALYLVCANKSDWDGMTVTFYDESGNAIKNSSNVSDIRANYVGDLVSGNPAVSGESTTVTDAVGHWFKVKIPDNAKTFVAKAGDSKETVSGDIYEYRTKTARYRTDYTLGDMQYRISDTGTGSSPTVHTLTRFYPIFTQDAVYTMPDNDDVSSTSGSTLVDESQILDSYIEGSPNAPTTTSGTSDEPVLHATASNTITYTWQEGGTSGNGVLWFDNSNLGWTKVNAHMWGSGNTTYPGTTMHTSDGGNTYYLLESEVGSYTNVQFNNADNSSDETVIKTEDLTLQKNKIFKPTSSGNMVIYVQKDSDNDKLYDSKVYAKFYTSSDDNAGAPNYNNGYGFEAEGGEAYTNPDDSDDKYVKKTFTKTKLDELSGTYTHVQFRGVDNTTLKWDTGKIPLGSNANNGKGFVYKIYLAKDGSLQTYDFFGVGNGSFTLSGSWDNHSTTVTYSTKFQPEDRYGYIQNAANQSDTNGTTATTNNFVKVVNNVSSLTDLHIKFFTDSAGSTRADVTTDVTGQSFPTNGIKLNPTIVASTYPAIDNTPYTDVGAGTAASPYLVRLPKNAKYAQLYNGSTAVGSIVDLADSSGKTGGITLTISGDSSSQTVSKSYVSRGDTGIQVNAKKTDMDYIYFTDENGTMSGIRAYYFGDADGEYCAWPGVAPSYSYTDSNGKNVYAFQYPTREGSTGKAYPYVIFNSGDTYPSSTMTIALNYSGSGNYSIITDTTQYGTNNSTAINAKHTNVTNKTNNPTVNYSTNNKYIFFVNNGTYNFGISGLSDRYILDDVHIEFFDMNKTPLQTTAPGYVMDKIGTYNKEGETATGDLYRIAIPSNAQYFRINNGTGKGSGTTKYNVRNSVIEEIAANGIYKFVDESNATADVWDGSDPSSAADLDDHNYKLKLINEKQPDPEDDDIIEPRNYEVRLARVETKNSANSDNGNISKIIWLKPAVGYEEENPQTTFDSEYLDYEGVNIADFLENNAAATVKVKKLGTYYWKETKVPTGYKIPDGESDEKIFIIEDRSNPIANIGTVTFRNEKLPEPTNKVILTKTAKEKVGDNDVGATLTGAKFLLYVNDGDNNDSNDTLAGTFNQAKDASNNPISGEYTYVSSGGAFNTNASDSTKYMETGNVISDTDHYGKLILNGLPVGDYYLKEMTAPAGYSVNDSNTGTNKCVYFSIGDNTVTKEITFSDEMAPAYIKLYEHINEKLPAWGDPTFIFKITNTTSGKTSIVALTVDDNGGLAANEDDTVLGTAYNAYKYIESTDELEGESPNQTLEYQGMYHIDNQGRIRLEPGTYTITRVPVSRYEFVADTFTDSNTSTFTANTTGAGCATGLEAAVSVTVNEGDTAIVHYYDKVAYYDKFSHVDEEINKFYTLDASKNNTTAKGIRVEYKPKVPTTGSEADINITNNDNFKAWFINVDGTERAMNDTDKAKLDISCLPADNNSADTSAFQFQTPTIKISTPSNFKDKVYTLTAEYKENNQTKFTTTFDLVFARS